ncbi:hypothetical protein BKH43_00660 [Helicobacter sp. 13S00401-1]|uniref:SAM-dependent methyltransferase n=1 Tax=Helicobacter sp. 13S00401-1 TaxID=1905758 RepID=UPI000BA5D90A|nr:SAM-dependent methyltransferase [Helicobacter sp. 13S00401-1]PAF51780.1 hypothetical protein BKH43_00660 [Helicobacter sp. 13S00401-1]
MITLEPFLNSWLKAYYAKAKIGFRGDFYTAVSRTKFFGAALANYTLRLLESDFKLPLTIVEIGSHDGTLISDMAEFMHAFDSFAFKDINFATLEPLEPLAILQEANFNARINKFNKNLKVYKDMNELKALDFVFFVSNELLDAFPCELVYKGKQAYIKHDGGVYSLVFDTVTKEVAKKLELYEVKGGEISLSLSKFIESLFMIKSWFFLAFDYGQMEERDISLRIYKDHKVYNFLEEKDKLSSFYETSDVTYDINFRNLEREFVSHGATPCFYYTQSKMLIEECEILEIFESFKPHMSKVNILKHTNAINELIMPNLMGERFKAVGFRR